MVCEECARKDRLVLSCVWAWLLIKMGFAPVPRNIPEVLSKGLPITVEEPVIVLEAAIVEVDKGPVETFPVVDRKSVV